MLRWAAWAFFTSCNAGPPLAATEPPPHAAAPLAADSSVPVAPQPDEACLVRLRKLVPDDFVALQDIKGVRTPVRIGESLRGLQLQPRGRQKAVMDCELALALAEAQPLFVDHGINRLSFSAAYHYRQRRDGPQLSNHSYGFAIDIHTLHGQAIDLDVLSHFEAHVGAWKSIVAEPGAEDRCIGKPVTQQGRVLRELVCALKLRTRLSVIVTPDDNSDHRDHLHLEVVPPGIVPALQAQVAERQDVQVTQQTAPATKAKAKAKPKIKKARKSAKKNPRARPQRRLKRNTRAR